MAQQVGGGVKELEQRVAGGCPGGGCGSERSAADERIRQAPGWGGCQRGMMGGGEGGLYQAIPTRRNPRAQRRRPGSSGGGSEAVDMVVVVVVVVWCGGLESILRDVCATGCLSQDSAMIRPPDGNPPGRRRGPERTAPTNHVTGNNQGLHQEWHLGPTASSTTGKQRKSTRHGPARD